MAKKALRGVMEYREYENQLSDDKRYVMREGKCEKLNDAEVEEAVQNGEVIYSEKEFIKKFYDEMYDKGFYGDGVILAKDVYKKEAHRNAHSLYRDAFNVSRNMDRLETLTEDQREVLELAADMSAEELAYAQGGRELAYQVIMDHSVRDLENGLDPRVVLSRYYIKMNKIKRQHRREKRNET